MRKDVIDGKPVVILEEKVKKIPGGEVHHTIYVLEERLLDMLPAIKADVADEMGYERYKKGLRELGYDV